MRTLIWYMDEARRVAGLDSDRKLADALNLSPPSVNRWRNDGTAPKDIHLIALAKLAGIPAEIILTDKQVWEASTDETRATWSRIAQKVAQVAAMLLVTVVTLSSGNNAKGQEQNAHTSLHSSNELYIMRQIDGGAVRSDRLLGKR